jgi:hypothetical protein
MTAPGLLPATRCSSARPRPRKQRWRSGRRCGAKPTRSGRCAGLPAALYSDHGADFTSTHIAQVCADLKVQVIHSTPGRPPLPRQDRTVLRHHHHRAAAHTGWSYPAGQPRQAGDGGGVDDLPARCSRGPVRRRGLPRPSAPRDRAGPCRPVGGRRLVAADAGVVGAARPAADHRHAAEGAT